MTITLTHPVLVGTNLGKRYGAIEALAGMDIALRRGEVTSLCGDNGKSTLAKILCGATTPTAETLQVNGEPVRLRSPHHAQQVGNQTVFQDRGIARTQTSLSAALRKMRYRSSGSSAHARTGPDQGSTENYGVTYNWIHWPYTLEGVGDTG